MFISINLPLLSTTCQRIGEKRPWEKKIRCGSSKVPSEENVLAGNMGGGNDWLDTRTFVTSIQQMNNSTKNPKQEKKWRHTANMTKFLALLPFDIVCVGAARVFGLRAASCELRAVAAGLVARYLLPGRWHPESAPLIHLPSLRELPQKMQSSHCFPLFVVGNVKQAQEWLFLRCWGSKLWAAKALIGGTLGVTGSVQHSS